MEEIYLYTHLGLGDMLICNGLVRNFYKKYKKINLFCKPKYLNHAKRMYSDININILPKDDLEAILYLKEINPKQIIIIGHNRMEEAFKITNYFNVGFYINAGINYLEQWNSFYFTRETEKEEIIFSSLNLNKENYIFLHEDLSRGYLVDRNKIIDKKNKIISPTFDLDKKFNIEDMLLYSKILENASEIHTIDSSFLWLADHLKLKTKNLFLHAKDRYVPSLTFYNWEKIF